jgi:hypothetical protein
MITVELKSAKDLKAVIEAAFPSYRKRRAFVSVFNGGARINSYWDGGSRSEFALVELASLRRASLPTATHPYFDVQARGMANASDNMVEVDHVGNITLKTLPEGFVLVEAGTFCGKAATAHVFVPAANMPKFLNA